MRMRSKQALFRFFVLGILGTLTALGASLASPQAVAQADSSTVNVDQFSYDSWHVEYFIDVDDSGRATANVTETLVAVFPDYDQNRGIVRALTTHYQGTSTAPSDFQVTDAFGEAVPFEVLTDRGYTMLLLGDDSYVHGEHTYVIEYTLRDIVLARDDGTADEWYWDLVPFERAQRIAAFSASVTFSESLTQSLNGDYRCYSGHAGSRVECELSRAEGTEAQFTIGAEPLAIYEGVTVAIGLAPGTITQPFARLDQPALDAAPLVFSVGAAGVAGAALIAVRREVRARARSRGVIVAQFEVPSNLPPLIASRVARGTGSPAAAQIVHLAVNGIIRIEEGDNPNSLRRGSAPLPRVRLLDPTRASDQLDRRTIETLFSNRVAGESFVIPRSSSTFAQKMTKLVDAGTIAAEDRGYLKKQHVALARKLGMIAVVIAGIALAGAIALTWLRNSELSGIAIFVAFGSGLLGLLARVRWRIHTPKGAQAREHLLGVREFIRVAEADRLNMLQSYAGAERQTIDGAEVIRLYEKLLPYAMLFGHVRDWAKVLEEKYSEMSGYSPAWYPAAAMHGLSGFSSTVSNLSGSLSSSVSYTSSSSGGSRGGGFAGGGGGGGFSGGR